MPQELHNSNIESTEREPISFEQLGFDSSSEKPHLENIEGKPEQEVEKVNKAQLDLVLAESASSTPLTAPVMEADTATPSEFLSTAFETMKKTTDENLHDLATMIHQSHTQK